MSANLLLIEDDEDIAEFVISGLQEEGYQVHHVLEGRAAQVALLSQDWDLVLLDWWLPVVDGLTVLKWYRSNNGVAPVLFLSAQDGVRDRELARASGANDYLPKPFVFEELITRIAALLSPKESANHRPL